MSMLSKQIGTGSEPYGELTPATFNDIRQLVYNNSGISLGENKQALVKVRVKKNEEKSKK